MPEFQSIHVATLAFFMLAVLANNIPFIDGVPDTTIVEYTCSQATWAENDPYGENVAYTVDELVWRTPHEPDSQMEWVGTYEGTTVYADAGCEQDLDGQDCFDCLSEAEIALEEWCRHSITGDMQMVDCSMRYGDQEL